jgi:hypothetical protein
MPAQQNDDLPAIGVIYETWLTTAQVAEMHDMSTSAVVYLCSHDRLRATKVGSMGRGGGEWRIDPDSAKNYKRKMPPKT